jgi:hypothetical protein
MGLLDDAIREHLELKRRRGADPDEVTRQENEALGAARRAEFARPEGGDAPAAAGEAAAPAEPAAEEAAAPFDHGTDEPAAPFDHEPSEPAPARHDPFAPAEPARESADEPAADEPFARAEPEPAADEPFARSEPADEPLARSEPAAPEESFAPSEPVSPPREAAPPDEPVVEDDAPVEAGDEREPFDVEAADTPADAPTQRHDWLEDEPDEVPAEEALDHPRREQSAEGDESEDVLEETPDFLQETPEHDRLWFEQRPPRDFDWDK